MGDYDDPGLTGQEPRRRRSLAVGAAVLALILGLAVGFVIGGGTSRDTSAVTVETAPDPTPVPAPAPDSTAPPASAACLRAGTAAAEVLARLQQAVAQIGALDASALRQTVERLEPLQDELTRAVADCRVESPAGRGGPTG